MNTILTKLKDFVGISEPDEYDYEEWEHDPNNDPEQRNRVVEEEPQPRRQNRDPLITAETGISPTTRNNVIGMPGIANGVAEVVVIEPHSFEEMPQVIQTLRERKSVVLNLNTMNPAEAQRAVDFVAGGTYAIDGHQERIGESIFLFTPSSVKVSTLSGVVHDVPEVAKAAPRSVPPTPTWGADLNRLAQ